MTEEDVRLAEGTRLTPEVRLKHTWGAELVTLTAAAASWETSTSAAGRRLG